MKAGALDVLIAGKLAETLSQDGAGSLSFAYERDYRGVPLSSSMPLSTRPYRDKVVLPYLWGLLPEDPAARRHVAADAGISPNNPFALLGGHQSKFALRGRERRGARHRHRALRPLGRGGNVTRLHQEDLCQALGCLPDCTDKMNIGDIERAIGASYELRNKKDLIEAFIDSLDSSNAARRPSRN